MFYTVYKITNTVNGKIYVGCHQTTNLDDNYMGSGKVLKLAIAKYGIAKFKREYLAIFDNALQMFETESTVVNDDFVQDPNTYNLKHGGNGGWSHTGITSSEHARALSHLATQRVQGDPFAQALRQENMRQIAKRNWENPEYRKGKAAQLSEFNRARRGSHMTPEVKNILSIKAKERIARIPTPTTGKIWIHSMVEKRSIIIDPEAWPEYHERKWIRGRKLKF